MDNFLVICQSIGQILAGVIISLYFCKSYLSKYINKVNIPKGIIKQNKVDLAILQELNNVRDILDADRIQIYEFHNGEHYSNYRSAYKMSCTYEVTKYGIKDIRDKCTALPIICMPEFIRSITEEGHCECVDITNMKAIMPSTYHFKNSLGIRAFYDTAIRNIKGEIIGFVAIQWETKQKYCPNEAEVLKLVGFIEGQLNNITN